MTLADISSVEASIVGTLLAGNATSAVSKQGGIVTLAVQLTIPTNVSNSSAGFLGVELADVGVSIFFPLLLFATIDLSDAILVVSSLEGASLAQGGQEAVSVIGISFLRDDGSPMSIADLAEPVRFSLPNANGSSLSCAWLDEDTGEWSTDGIYMDGFAEDGNVVCATTHFTLFAAIAVGVAEGFTETLECTQVALLAAESYVELWNNDWHSSVGTQLLFVLLAGLFVIVSVSCVLDVVQQRRGYWKTEYFLIANAAAPAQGAMVALAAGVGTNVDIKAGCMEATVGGLREALDDFLGSICEQLGDIRHGLEEVCTCNFEGFEIISAALAAIQRSALRSTSATYFLLADDVDILLSDDVDELISPKQEDPTDDVAGGAGSLDLDFDIDGRSMDNVLQISGRLPEAGAPHYAAVPAGVGLFSQGAARRHRRMVELREELRERQRHQLNSHASWCHLPRALIGSLLVHGPVGSVLCRSITASHSLRALLLCADLLGSLMLATLFCSATGGAMGKRSSKGCSEDCFQEDGFDDAMCYYKHFGRLIAIGMCSGVIAGFPIAMLSSLHQREFVRVAYEGSPDWHRQLRCWRRGDAAIFVFGTSYCVFAIHYICLFFANVADSDQAEWMISAGVSLLEDFIIIPTVIGFTITLIALVLLSCVSCKYGVPKSHIMRPSSVEAIRELFSSTSDRGEIQRTLTGDLAASTSPTSDVPSTTWAFHELRASHDVSLADPRHLALVPRGLG